MEITICINDLLGGSLNSSLNSGLNGNLYRPAGFKGLKQKCPLIRRIAEMALIR